MRVEKLLYKKVDIKSFEPMIGDAKLEEGLGVVKGHSLDTFQGSST